MALFYKCLESNGLTKNVRNFEGYVCLLIKKAVAAPVVDAVVAIPAVAPTVAWPDWTAAVATPVVDSIDNFKLRV